MNSRGLFFSVYSRFNPRASVSLGLVPEHTTALFSFKCTVHARGGPEPSLKHNHTSPFLFPTDSTFNPKQDTTKTYKWGRAAKCLSLNTADSFALASSLSQGENQWGKGEKRGMYVVNYSSTWWKCICFKCWGERRETAIKHIWSIFHFQGSDCLPEGTATHIHTQDYRNRAFQPALFYCKDTRSVIPELLFDVVILL